MINVRELTIGSHVLVDGKRERVRGIDEDNGLIVRFPAEYVLASDVEPLPITPALLEELGFEWRPKSSCWRKYKHLTEDDYEWGIYASDCNNGYWHIDLYLKDYRMNPKGYCESLHELESFLALYNVELIND